jgi:hypothetical protein
VRYDFSQLLTARSAKAHGAVQATIPVKEEV